MTDLPEIAKTTPEDAKDFDAIPKEVASAGVSVHPISIPIPKPVQQVGVMPAGANVVPPVVGTTIPLTDDQIAQGLKMGIRDSFLWLAQWCVRRLKQIHIGLKSIHGKLIRVQSS